MELILVRHTRPSVRRTCYGRLDVALAESAAGDIKACLARIPPTSRVVTSLRNVAVCLHKPLPIVTGRRSERMRGYANSTLDVEGKLWSEVEREAHCLAQDSGVMHLVVENRCVPVGKNRSVSQELATNERARIVVVSHRGRCVRCKRSVQGDLMTNYSSFRLSSAMYVL